MDLELELRNTGDQEIQYWKLDVDDDSAYVKFDLQGPDSLALDARQSVGILNAKQLKVATLPPGGVERLKITSMRGGAEGLTYHYWLQTGEYTLRASIFTAVKPAPKGAQLVGEAREFGAVAVTGAPIKLQVVDKVEKGKVDPPGTPLELKLTSKKDSYPLNLGGKTPAEFRKGLKEAFQRGDPPPPAPEVDLELQIKNTGKEAVTFMVGGDSLTLNLQLDGPGAVSGPSGMNFTDVVRPGRLLTLKSGETHTFGWTRLTYGQRGASDVAFWTAPGEYRLTAIVKTSIPGPDSKSGQSQPIELTSAPISLKVVEPQK